MSDRVIITITARIDGTFHVGGGKGVVANTAYVLRDEKQRVYLPGSSLKGKLRHNAMLLQETCSSVQHDPGNVDCSCDVCALFGAPGNARGKLKVGSLCSTKDGYTATEQRTGNQVDRMRRTVDDNKLFSIEAVSDVECGDLVGDIVGYNLTRAQEKLLLRSIIQVEWIGGNTSRGLGRVRLIPKVKIDVEYDKAQFVAKNHERVCVLFTPESPLFIGKQTRQSNFRDTLDYIPGEVVRASLAAIITAECGSGEPGKRNWVTKPNDNSDRRYVSLRTVFPDIRISTFRPFGAKPYPFTAKKGKYCNHVMDTLAYKLSSGISEIVCNKGKCVNERTDDIRGWRELETDKYMALNTRSAINNRLGVVQDEALFSQQVLVPREDAGNRLFFSGWIYGDFCKNELVELLTNPSLRIGALQSVGYGKVSAKLVEPENDSMENLRSRINVFNDLITVKDTVYIPLLLLSDAVIDATSDNVDALTLVAGLFPRFTWHKAYVRAKRWRGVNTYAVAGQFKKSQLLLEAGSVFVIKVVCLTDVLLSDLLNLEESLPYGMELRVADEFHIEEAYIHE